MLIDCDTCTARGTGCADCVVTVLLGAPPGWQTDDPVVVALPDRASATAPVGAELAAEDVVVPPPGVVVEFDEVERRAVRVLADVGLVPPLRHQSGRASDAGGRRPGRAPGAALRGGKITARRGDPPRSDDYDKPGGRGLSQLHPARSVAPFARGVVAPPGDLGRAPPNRPTAPFRC